MGGSGFIMNYAKITKYDIANGQGVRVVLWVSGCDHHCKNCHNQETWNPNYGEEFTIETYKELIDALAPDYISGITFSGGDPMKPENVTTCMEIANLVKQKYPNKDIWCWTGYTLDELTNRNDSNTNYFLGFIDYLIDGEFVEELKDITLKWRGSSNQRIYKKVNYSFVDVTKELG